MEFRSVGDIASSLQLNQSTSSTKTEINRLIEELSTGVASDTGQAVSGDFSLLSAISGESIRLEAYQNGIAEAAVFVSAGQSALELIQNDLVTAGTNLIAAGNSGADIQISSATVSATDAFRNAINAINIDVGGKSVFAGTATDQTPLTDPTTFLAELATVVSGITTAGDVNTAIDDWFDDASAGYDASAYQGSSNALAPIQLSDASDVSFGVSATHDAIKDTLAALAKAALLSDDTLSLSEGERAALAISVGGDLVNADASVTVLRASIGSVEAEIESASVENEYELSSVEILKNELLGIDEYRAATELQNAETQLQLLYTLTARMSQLSLSDYI